MRLSADAAETRGRTVTEPSPEDFARFADSLTRGEKAAVEAWLGMGAVVLREFQLYGSVPPQISRQEMAAVQEDFGRAMAKAVLCTQVVFRGLSAGRWRPEAAEYLSSVIHGRETFSIATYDSATASESIGRAFCRLEPDDEERHLAVLMLIRPMTARWLRPFVHRALDEGEVILMKGTHYRREAVRRLPNPKDGLEFWEVDLVETAG